MEDYKGDGIICSLSRFGIQPTDLEAYEKALENKRKRKKKKNSKHEKLLDLS